MPLFVSALVPKIIGYQLVVQGLPAADLPQLVACRPRGNITKLLTWFICFSLVQRYIESINEQPATIPVVTVAPPESTNLTSIIDRLSQPSASPSQISDRNPEWHSAASSVEGPITTPRRRRPPQTHHHRRLNPQMSHQHSPMHPQHNHPRRFDRKSSLL